MLKMIKTTKQMRLDELIKYVWDNGITNREFQGNYFKRVEVNEVGEVRLFMQETPIFSFDKHNTFTVEIEEPITEYTEFDCILEIRKGSLTHIRRRKTIKENLTEETERFYALINGHLELVWEADGE